MSVPGVNVTVAATFMAAVGDIGRFPDRRKLTAYLGLDPRVRQSGATPATHGHISKHGSNSARHALVEACWSTVRQPGPIAAFYARVKAKRGHSIAIVASARKLACLFWCLLTRGEDYAFAPAVADGQEDAPPRARRRRPALAGRPPRLVDQHRDARRRTHTRAPSPARLRTHDQRPPATEGRERDSGPRISWLLKGASRAADHRPQVCALTGRRPRPTELCHQSPRSSKPT
jgi:hypothetical protein